MSQVLLIAELRSAARYAGLSLADRAADRIEELEAALHSVLNQPETPAAYDAMMQRVTDALAGVAPVAVQPVAVFDGYIAGGTAIIQWRDKGLPVGTLLYAAQSAALSI